MNPTDPPKRGRPKGSKTRPQWVRDMETQNKRPRGRPKGSPNKPKTFEAFLKASLSTALPPKVRRPRNERKARTGASNYLNTLTPEERSALARKAASSRKRHGARPPGTPTGLTEWEFAPVLIQARKEAQRIFNIMDQDGILPEDPLAREALLEVLTLMRLPGDKQLKHQLARTILEYWLAKPTTKQDVTVRSAEDWLDEIAAEQVGDESAE